MPALRSSILLVLLLAATTNALAQDDGEDVITVDSSVVVLNARITDSAGRHVSGIGRTEFSIFENGDLQEIEFFQAEETPFAGALWSTP